MPIQPVLFSDQELKIIQEVKQALGFETDEQTIEYLLSTRLKEQLLKMAGQQLKSKPRRHFF